MTIVTDYLVTSPNQALNLHSQGELAGGEHLVYAFYDSNGTCLYVGQTWDPRTRFQRHRSKSRWWRHASQVLLVYVESEKAARALEKTAIGLLSPTHNIVRYQTTVRRDA